MNMDTLVEELDAEIARLKQARTLLSGTESPAVAKKLGRPAGVVTVVKAADKPEKAAKKKAKRTLSPEARKAIGDAQKKRWAKVAAQKKAAAKAAANAQATAPAKVTAKRTAKAAKKVVSKPTVKAAKKVSGKAPVKTAAKVTKKVPAKAVVKAVKPIEPSTPQQ